MGWGNCGEDSKGRPIGYMHEATCDHEGCDEKIDRGLSYACGGRHGDCGGQACDKYFCTKHMKSIEKIDEFTDELSSGQLCFSCYERTTKIVGELVLSGDYKVEYIKPT